MIRAGRETALAVLSLLCFFSPPFSFSVSEVDALGAELMFLELEGDGSSRRFSLTGGKEEDAAMADLEAQDEKMKEKEEENAILCPNCHDFYLQINGTRLLCRCGFCFDIRVRNDLPSIWFFSPSTSLFSSLVVQNKDVTPAVVKARIGEELSKHS